MSEKVRCPACRGAKKVPKLGGMIGECNTCSGSGSIVSGEFKKPVIADSVDSSIDAAVIKAVSDGVPAQQANNDKFVGSAIVDGVKLSDAEIDSAAKKFIESRKTESVDSDVKVDAKKAIYKRKAK